MSERETFTELLREGGLPTTEAEVRAEFEAEVASENVAFTNDSTVSPWWRMVTALITKPVMWLIDALITSIMPQMFVKTATGAFLDLLAWGVGLERKQAAAAAGFVTFTRATTAGTLDIPAGTAVQSPTINGRVYTLRTTETVTFADGMATAQAPVEAAETGSAYNLAQGYYSVLPVLLPGITAVTNPEGWLTQPGADREPDDELRARIRTQFLAVNQWHTDAVYRALISSFDGVAPDNVFFDSDAPRGPGTADAYVMLEIGTPDAAFIAPIQSLITDEGNHGHGDDLRVFAMPETQHDVIASIYLMENLSAETREEQRLNVADFIRAAFRENQEYTPTLVRPWSRFSFSFLAGEMHTQFPLLRGVDFNLDYIISGMDLPRLGSLSVTLAE